jgi:hypothetical protein
LLPLPLVLLRFARNDGADTVHELSMPIGRQITEKNNN